MTPEQELEKLRRDLDRVLWIVPPKDVTDGIRIHEILGLVNDKRYLQTELKIRVRPVRNDEGK